MVATRSKRWHFFLKLKDLKFFSWVLVEEAWWRVEDCCLVICRYRWLLHFLLLSCWPQFLWKMNLTKMLKHRLTPPPCMCILAYCALKSQTVGRDQYDRSSHEMMKQSYNARTLLQPGKSWTVCFFWWGGPYDIVSYCMMCTTYQDRMMNEISCRIWICVLVYHCTTTVLDIHCMFRT